MKDKMKKEKKESLNSLLNFFKIAGKLKETIRFGAAKYVDGDSSADHSWRLALMVFTMSREMELKIDIEKAMKIAIVHDIAEGITGEIDARDVYVGKISKKKKYEMELRAMRKIKNSLPEKIGEEIYSLWIDYEEDRNEEARFVKAMDKIETLVTLLESGHKTYDLPEMIPNYADKAVNNFPKLKKTLEMIKGKFKKEFKKGKIPWKKEYENFSGYEKIDY
jgi:putative hydrolases of HD superfamily